VLAWPRAGTPAPPAAGKGGPVAFLLVPVVVLAVLALWVIGLYNGLVRGRNACDESWAGIDVELKRRHDLIPNLVETVKGYAGHERGTLEAVIAARSAAVRPHDSPAAQARDENALMAGVRQIFALAERYPDLKANANFGQLQAELAATEDRIQRARRTYNGQVREQNDRIQTFPGSLVAGPFGFSPREFFELDEPAAREAPKVSF
jgi:LemA protein